MENKKQEYTKEEQEKFIQAQNLLSSILSGEGREGLLTIQVSKNKGILVGVQGDYFTIASAIRSILKSDDEKNNVVKNIIKSGYLMSRYSVPDLTAAIKSCNDILEELNDTMSRALKKKGGKRK